MSETPTLRRTYPALELSNSPLIFVLAQMRMTPVEDIANHIPAVQGRLRKEGYPQFSRRNIEVKTTFGDQSKTVETASNWEFMDLENHWSIIVGNRSISLQTTYYTNFDDFLERFAKALDTIHDVISIGGVARLGLRYLDLVNPGETSDFSDYLTADLLGLDLSEIGERSNQRYESSTETQVGQLIFRCTECPAGSLALDPNLLPVELEFRYPTRPQNRFCLLDSDHFRTFDHPRPFDGPEASRMLSDLHDDIDRVFRMAVTKKALTRHWK